MKGRHTIKKLLTISLAFCFVLILSPSVLSKRPKYKALFNLASDARYYKYVEYKSSHRFDHMMLLSLVDKRPEQEKVYNEDTQWFYDDIWAVPIDRMLRKIFLRELRITNMFKSVDVDEKAPSLILKIELTSLIGHYGTGRVARGVIKIQSILRSASDNRVVMDKDYEETSSSLVPRFGNAYRYMYLHIGKALNGVVKELTMDLENTLLRESGK